MIKKAKSLIKKISGILFVILNIASVGLYPTAPAYAATFTFTQSSWSSGITANTATHTSNQSGWTEYSATSTGMTVGSTVAFSQGSFAFTDDGATSTSSTIATYGGDFDNGTTASTTVTGTGTGASVGLSLPASYSCGATGGTTSTTTGYCINTFTATTTTTFTPSVDGTVDYLVVGGGGGGGYSGSFGGGGAGGAGGFLTGTEYSVIAGTPYIVTVGGGGAANVRGATSTFDIISANGGGRSARTTSAAGAYDGGSGGGFGNAGPYYGFGNIPSTTPSQGNNGSGSTKGGGGGAGAAGSGGNGGIGRTSNIAGLSVCPAGGTAPDCYYAGGGNGAGGAGGLGGGGNSAGNPGGANGTNGTGGGAAAGNASGGSGIVIVRYYAIIGTFTSAVVDLGAKANLTTFDYTKTLNGQTISINARAGNTATPDGTWTAWQTNITSGGSISGLTGNRYFQYRAIFSTMDTAITPTLDSVTVNYNQYALSGNLTSSVYDSTDATSLISSLTWTESGTTTNETIQFQVRSSADNATWSNWCGYADTGSSCAGSNYFTYAHNGVSLASNHSLRSNDNDRYLQYKVFLTSGGALTPTLTSVTTTYVVNAAPTVNVTGTIQTAQIDTNNSTVTVTYNLSDTETDSYEAYLFYNIGVTLSSDNTTTLTVSDTSHLPAAPGYIEIGNEVIKYGAITNGTTLGTLTRGGTDNSWPGTSTRHTNPYVSGSVVWVKASAVTGATGTVSKGNGQTIVWTPSSEANLANYNNTTAQVRVLVHDGNAANMLSSSSGSSADSSSNVFIDNAKPVNATPRPILYDAGVAGETNSGSITIYPPVDATSTQYFITDNSGNSTTWTSLSGTSTISWTFDSAISSKSIGVKYRDNYGNTQTATTTLSTINPPASNAFLVQDVSKLTVSDWREYIAWETATSGSFASYKLEYATSTDNITYSNYSNVASITNSATNYYVHTGLTTSWYYRYRVGVTDTNGNTSVRSSAYINAKPDGVQNLGEGGGGSSPTAPLSTNIVGTQNTNGTVSVSYNLKDTSITVKTTPTYEAYVLYDVGSSLVASSTSTILVSDSSKLPSSGYIQINNEVIKYTGNTTSTGTLSGITRGTWPNYLSSTRETITGTILASSTPVWIVASSTATSISNSSIATGQTGVITWNVSNDTNIANNYLSNISIRVLIHDNQGTSSGPISTQNATSEIGRMTVLDLKAPVLSSTSLLINGSSSTTESSSSNATLTLSNITGDTNTESIQIQFATSTPAVWRGANSDGTINMTPGSWGSATPTASLVGSWSWPLSDRSETISVRIKDTFGNISNTDTNSNQKNSVPEFNGSQTDSDASGYESVSHSDLVIRQCNVFDTDSLCTAGKVKVKFQIRDADTAQGVTTPGYVTTAFATSLNSGAYATSSIVTYSDGLVDVTSGVSSVNANGTTFTTVTAYYNPSLGSSATLTARIAVTDNETGTTPQWATSNTINYDIVNPTGSVTFDAGTAGSASSATLTIPLPTDATTTQYMISATSTSGTLSTYGWTTLSAATTLSHGFDSAIDSKSVFYRFRDTYGNISSTSTASALLPPLASNVSIQDISNTTAGTWRTFISWEASTSSSFSLYRLESASSTDNSVYTAFSDLINISTAGTNYYMHSGVSGTYYRYRLSTKNTSSNYSVKSSAYWTALPDGTLNQNESSANDTTAPSLNTVSSSSLKATGVTVTFNSTDNASLVMNDTVYYATQADFTNNVNSAKTGRNKYVNKFGNPGYVTVGSVGATAAHSIIVTGLIKNQGYRYGVESCDATGNCTFEDASEAGYSFTTLNGPAIVSGSVSVTPSFDSAVVTWKTDNPSDGQVFYATSSSAVTTSPTIIGASTQITSADGNGQYVHTFTISGLSYNASYYYKVRSTDQNASSNTYTQYDESAVNSFTTTSQTPPSITVAATCSTTDSTAIVSWTTDQVSTTEISMLTSNVPGNYFSTTAGAQYAQYPLSTTTLIDDAARTSFDYVLSHANTFTGLSQSTTYYVKIRSLNHSGGEVSNTLTCATTAQTVTIIARPPVVVDTTAPVISSLIINDIKGTSATITWITDELADSLVKYGKSSNYGALNGNEEREPTHTVTLSGLVPETTYYFKVTSADASGNRAYAGDQTLTTVSLGDEAITTKEQLLALQKELQDLRDKASNTNQKAKSLAQAVEEFKRILKSVSTDVSLQDLENLTSDITDTITDITQEVTPPNILGGVPQVDVESNKATVTWRTNKESNSIIALVPQDEYDAKAKDPYTLQVGQPQEEVNNHVVTIPNLRASTIYHFQIRSKAKIGPEGKSKDFLFETMPELPIILDYSFKNISEKSITVTWKTNVVSTSQIKYTPFVNGVLNVKESKTEGRSDYSTIHEVTTTNMTPNTNFQIEISSADVSGGAASKIIGTIQTTIDVKAPTISKVRSESTLFPGKIEKTQTIIYWETDEPSSSQIFWKEGVAKGDLLASSRLDKELTTSHVVVLTTFAPGSVYRFQVESTDASGNSARSTDYTLLTSKQGQTVIDLIITNFQDIFGFLKKL